MIFSVLFLLVLPLWRATAEAATPTTNPLSSTIDILTSYTGYDNCTDAYISILKQTVNDAQKVADAGLDYIHDELVLHVYPQRSHQQVDFSKEAAIEFFGPEKENAPEQARIFDAMFNAAHAYPGWGFLDWLANRYVYLSCNDVYETKPCGAGVIAYYFPTDAYKYPLVVFCPAFFTSIQSLDDAVQKIDDNPDLQQNSLNLESRATVFIHELLHIGWGKAKECRGLEEGEGCSDHHQLLGGKPAVSYSPGAAKLLAKRNITLAATNSDNYAFYAASKFMQKRWKQYPKYPSAWDPDKTEDENREAQKSEPGFPPERKSAEWQDYIYDVAKEPLPPDLPNDPIYPVDDYPDWYQPVVKAAPGSPVPDITEPTDNMLTYNGPANDDIVCETSNGSPEINDCFHAFGSLRSAPTFKAIQGKKGGTWWAGYVQSCALAIYYTDDWGNGCAFTLKDVDDYSTAIIEKCLTGDFDKIGGHADITTNNCTGRVEIIHTAGRPPPGT